MEYAIRQFFRLLRPLLVVAAIITWIVGQAQQDRSGDSASKVPIATPVRMGSGIPTLTFDRQHQQVRLTRAVPIAVAECKSNSLRQFKFQRTNRIASQSVSH